MEKSSENKFILLLIIWGAIVLIYTIVKQVIKILARIIVYFGLYIPFFYMITGSILVGLGYFRFEVIDLNSILFYIGIALCVVCSIIITIKTYVKRPVSSITEGCKEEIEEAKQKFNKNKRSKEQSKPKEDPILYVYHSLDHPELLIEEHEDRFVVFYDDGEHELQFLRVEPKTIQ